MTVSSRLKWFIAIMAVILTMGGAGALASASSPVTSTAVIFVSPHPDDEFQHWSLMEQRDDVFDVVVLLTRGEETRFCEPDGLAGSWQRALEPAPQPMPQGRFTSTCEVARVASFLSYFTEMAKSDSSIPGRSWTLLDGIGAAANAGSPACRIDGGSECIPSTSVDVYQDRAGHGAVVIFDLGDGDVTREETRWAIRFTIDEVLPEVTPQETRLAGIVGSYSTPSEGHPGCFAYPHPDHLALDDTLWTDDFGSGFQASATCALDPRRRLSDRVSTASVDSAFETAGPGKERRGAHSESYGWLHPEYYPVDAFGQRELFHSDQHFWVRLW